MCLPYSYGGLFFLCHAVKTAANTCQWNGRPLVIFYCTDYFVLATSFGGW
jgi:hypothetical protein